MEHVQIDREFKSIIPGFLGRREDDFKLISQAIDEGDFEEIAHLAHKIKGNAAGFGFIRATEIAEKMEYECDKRNMQKIDHFYKELVQYFRNIEIDYIDMV